jgi:hypothetical protein
MKLRSILAVLILTTFSSKVFAGAQVVCMQVDDSKKSKKEFKLCLKDRQKECKTRGYGFNKNEQSCDINVKTPAHKKCLKKGGSWSVDANVAGYALGGYHYKGECIAAEKSPKK